MYGVPFFFSYTSVFAFFFSMLGESQLMSHFAVLCLGLFDRPEVDFFLSGGNLGRRGFLPLFRSFFFPQRTSIWTTDGVATCRPVYVPWGRACLLPLRKQFKEGFCSCSHNSFSFRLWEFLPIATSLQRTLFT